MPSISPAPMNECVMKVKMEKEAREILGDESDGTAD